MTSKIHSSADRRPHVGLAPDVIVVLEVGMARKNELGLELPRVDGHPPQGRTQRRESRMGRPAKYPTAFRREVIEPVRSSGRPVAEVARSLDVAEGTLWH